MKKASKETKREQRYNANLHNIFVKAQKEINANEQYGRNLCPSDKKKSWDTILNLTPIITMEYKEINSLIAKCIRERNNPKATGKEFREALANAEEALRELRRFY